MVRGGGALAGISHHFMSPSSDHYRHTWVMGCLIWAQNMSYQQHHEQAFSESCRHRHQPSSPWRACTTVVSPRDADAACQQCGSWKKAQTGRAGRQARPLSRPTAASISRTAPEPGTEAASWWHPQALRRTAGRLCCSSFACEGKEIAPFLLDCSFSLLSWI